jgi:ABC-type methionine transport system ATPase subunit
MMISGRKNRKERAKYLLDMVGLAHKYKSRLSELSGGEQQRIAIAIALANNPRVLLADEPTGSVDSKTTYKIMEIFNRLNTELGVTIIIVTHDRKISSMVKRVVSISDGMISSEMHKKEDYLKKFSELDGTIDINDSHKVYTIVDKKGRVKIPEEYITDLKLSGGDKIEVLKSEKGIELFKA